MRDDKEKNDEILFIRQYKPIKSSKSNETLIAKLYETTEVKAVLDSGLEMGNIIPKAIVEKHNEMNATEPIKLHKLKRRVPIAFVDLEEAERCEEYARQYDVYCEYLVK